MANVLSDEASMKESGNSQDIISDLPAGPSVEFVAEEAIVVDMSDPAPTGTVPDPVPAVKTTPCSSAFGGGFDFPPTANTM